MFLNVLLGVSTGNSVRAKGSLPLVCFHCKALYFKRRNKRAVVICLEPKYVIDYVNIGYHISVSQLLHLLTNGSIAKQVKLSVWETWLQPIINYSLFREWFQLLYLQPMSIPIFFNISASDIMSGFKMKWLSILVSSSLWINDPLKFEISLKADTFLLY